MAGTKSSNAKIDSESLIHDMHATVRSKRNVTVPYPHQPNWGLLVFYMFLGITGCMMHFMPCDFIGWPPSGCHKKVEKTLNGIELFGPIHVTPAGMQTVENLVFLFRESFIANSGRPRSGVISFSGGSREASWWFYLGTEPKNVDCNAVDLNADGVKDCLVVGENNLMKAVDSLSGEVLWDIAGLVLDKCEFEFPAVLPDLDGDGVRELLSICSVRAGDEEEGVKYFVLVSGRSGTGMGKWRERGNCYSIGNMTLSKDGVISYGCSDSSDKGSLNYISLRVLHPNANYSMLYEKSSLTVIRRNINNDGNSLHTSEKRLRVENEGRCPRRCRMTVMLDDEKTKRKNRTVWVMERRNSFGMIPVTLEYGNFTGFLFKYWQWECDETCEGPNSETSETRNDDGRKYSPRGGRKWRGSRRVPWLRGKYDGNHSGETENQEQRRFLRNQNLTLHKIVEKIVMIICDGGRVHLKDMGQGDILQLCRNGSYCQPDGRSQRQSLITTDVYGSGFENSISYTSSYIWKRNKKSSSQEDGGFQLESKIEIMDVERKIAREYLRGGHKYSSGTYIFDKHPI